MACVFCRSASFPEPRCITTRRWSGSSAWLTERTAARRQKSRPSTRATTKPPIPVSSRPSTRSARATAACRAKSATATSRANMRTRERPPPRPSSPPWRAAKRRTSSGTATPRGGPVIPPRAKPRTTDPPTWGPARIASLSARWRAAIATKGRIQRTRTRCRNRMIRRVGVSYPEQGCRSQNGFSNFSNGL